MACLTWPAVCRRRIALLALAAAVIPVAALADDATSVDPATLPNAVRELPGERMMYLLAGSSIGVTLPPHMPVGDVGGEKGVIAGDLMCFFTAQPAVPATQPTAAAAPAGETAAASTTQPAAEALEPPDEKLRDQWMKPLQFTVQPLTFVSTSEHGYAFTLHYTVLNCHNEKVDVTEYGRKVGDQVVDGWTPYPHADPKDQATAEHYLTMMMDSAKVVKRYAVGPNGFEQTPEEGTAKAKSGRPAHTAAAMSETPAAPMAPRGGGGGSSMASSSSGSNASSYAAQQDAWASAALAAGRKLAADGHDQAAYEKFQHIAAAYPNTSAAKDAQAAVEKYQADPAFMAKENGQSPATTQPTAAAVSHASTADPAARAASALAMAESYLAAGKTDLARTRFQAIVDRYPGTPAAKTAKEHLTDMQAAGQ